METVEAELRGWEPAPFGSKSDVDANYKAMLDVLTDPSFDDAVDIGVGSHNLFDVAWALGIRDRMLAAGRRDRLGIEMLEGMAPSQSEAVRSVAGDLVLYAPIVQRGDFPSALAYLVRRLDENTAPANFLSQLFDLADDPARFERQADLFRAAVGRRHRLDHRPRRQQASSDAPVAVTNGRPVRQRSRHRLDPPGEPGVDRRAHCRPRRCILGDRRSPPTMSTGRSGPPSGAQAQWWDLGADERSRLLHSVADSFEHDRGRILATMAHEAGKTVPEGDAEVSEAIDFARYYAADGRRLAGIDDARPAALGTVLVASPWNFPFAIPAGGVLAALAAGSAVILKPAPQSVDTAALIVELCVEAGIPADAVQFVPAPDGDVGRRLVTHPLVDAVVLTGSLATATMFLEWRPALRLHGETSGKNAMVISATADIDHAVADLVRSAFGHAGQKCSAASLAIVEASLHDDPAFLERLRDAAATLRVGPATDLATDVGPLIEPPGPALTRALTSLEPGESWLLEPTCRSADRRTWTAGIRVGVRPGVVVRPHRVFRAGARHHPRRRPRPRDRHPERQRVRSDGRTARARPRRGRALARPGRCGQRLRQPRDHRCDRATPAVRRVEAVERRCHGQGRRTELRRLTDALVRRRRGPCRRRGAAVRAMDVRASVDAERDVTGLRSEHNRFRYRTGRGVAVRFGPLATDRERRLVEAAARVTGARVIASDVRDETDGAFAASISGLVADRLRLIGLTDDATEIRQACHAAGIAVDDGPPVCAPAIELPSVAARTSRVHHGPPARSRRRYVPVTAPPEHAGSACM